MRLTILAIGRMKQGPERELAERYRRRATEAGARLGFHSLDIREIPESRARETPARLSEEAASVAALAGEHSIVVALDEHGKNLDSADLARQIGDWRDRGAPEIVFIIGGADGLSPQLVRQSRLSLAFGSATWPHQLVRVMLLEQIYRAMTILAGHPYHRA
jgi:23S rRNA (pseudouridine1915-N3)-methyltransferase